MVGWLCMSSVVLKKKTVVICNFPRFSGEIWMPFLWAQAKTYYELYGSRKDEWTWFPCYADVYSTEYTQQIKGLLINSDPDVFAISLYVWNYTLAHEIAAWVKSVWPKCIIISGGPHQYFKHDLNWFKEHPHLDASLPGDCYGEQCFLEVLDNYDDATATVDWTKVTDMYYPSKSRMVLSNKVSMSRAERKVYKFDWSGFDAQLGPMIDFVRFQQQHFPNSMLLSVLETTRGCPYGCTYCDWGGGTSTTVLQKSLPTVKTDIDALMNFDLTYIYLADANFGIFGERDVDVMQYIAYQKIKTRQWFGVGFGGYAKTENKLEYIRDILAIDIDNNISMTKELKISMQTLDEEVLKNIDRKNIDLDNQLDVFEPLSKNKKLPLYVEMIMGLPGIDLEKYYYELDILGERHLSVQWFEWILLPETPAYAGSYREQYGIKTIIKKKGWAVKEEGSEREVVIGCKSYSTGDYLQMILSNSLYHLFVLGGFQKDTISWIRKNHNLGYGQISRDIYENFFRQHEYKNEAQIRWEKILTDSDSPCVFDVGHQNVYGAYYFVALVFTDPIFANNLIEYLQSKYNVPADIVNGDLILNINSINYGKKIVNWLYTINYKKDISFQQNDVHSLIGAFRTYIDAGNTMRGKKKLFGLFKCGQ